MSHVSDFIIEGKWDISKLQHWVPNALLMQILCCPISSKPILNDIVVWDEGNRVSFLIALAYAALKPTLALSLPIAKSI